MLILWVFDRVSVVSLEIEEGMVIMVKMDFLAILVRRFSETKELKETKEMLVLEEKLDHLVMTDQKDPQELDHQLVRILT